jgi:hypothetical protein
MAVSLAMQLTTNRPQLGDYPNLSVCQKRHNEDT